MDASRVSAEQLFLFIETPVLHRVNFDALSIRARCIACVSRARAREIVISRVFVFDEASGAR